MRARIGPAISSCYPCGRILDQLVDVIAALAVALGALDAEHVELAFDVAEDEMGPRHLRDR
jgi:hypothetical protein